MNTTLTLTSDQLTNLRFFLMTWGKDATKTMDEQGYEQLKDEAWELIWAVKEQVGN